MRGRSNRHITSYATIVTTQPREVENAAQVFEEMIATIGQLSADLKGDVVDQDQQRLTEQTLQQIEARLV
jgi:cell division protein ZipA